MTSVSVSSHSTSNNNLSNCTPTSSSTLKQPMTYGVTKPLSLAGPTPTDLALAETLEQVLKQADFFESDEEGERREIVLGRLHRLVNEFVRHVTKEKGYPDTVVKDIQGRIFTFGSYRLGVHAKGADIDTLCVAPQSITRQDFFSTFPHWLAKEKDISEITPVPDAYVPVLNMCVAGISIDLVFARLPVMTVSDDPDLLRDVNVLRNLDEKCILSLNGSRTTDEILRLVPNVSTFHTALRAIKLWAKRRGLYNNAMGYIAGVACALLTARICQLFPNGSAAFIVFRFFHVYKQWQWPHPVYLKDIEEYPNLNLKVWNPRLNTVDRQHRMPVITPAYPSMCSTHNVSASTLRFMTTEFERGYQICSTIYDKSSQKDSDDPAILWNGLFAPSDFFRLFRHFIQIIAISDEEHPLESESKEVFEDQEDIKEKVIKEGDKEKEKAERGEIRHRKWSGFVEAKIRFLTQKLEMEPGVEWAPPYYKSFGEDVVGAYGTLEEVFLSHMYFPHSTNIKKEKGTDEKESKRFRSTAFYLGIGVAKSSDPIPQAQQGTTTTTTTTTTTVRVPRRLMLERPITEFKAFMQTWDQYGPDLQLVIRDLKREQLATYIFPEDARPSVKSPSSTATSSSSTGTTTKAGTKRAHTEE